MTIFLLNRRRSTVAAVVLMSLALGPLGCKRHKATVLTTEESPLLASVVATADPRLGTQLVSGFYGVESNAWRWTAGRFSVVLRPPSGAASKGATVQLKFAIPAVAMAKVKTLSLSAYVNGTPLAPESYTQAGQYTYSREVPPSLLTGGDVVKVDFSVDHTLPPSPADHRELGVVVSLISLQSK